MPGADESTWSPYPLENLDLRTCSTLKSHRCSECGSARLLATGSYSACMISMGCGDEIDPYWVEQIDEGEYCGAFNTLNLAYIDENGDFVGNPYLSQDPLQNLAAELYFNDRTVLDGAKFAGKESTDRGDLKTELVMKRYPDSKDIYKTNFTQTNADGVSRSKDFKMQTREKRSYGDRKDQFKGAVEGHSVSGFDEGHGFKGYFEYAYDQGRS